VVLCVASRRDQNNGSKILKVHGTLVQEINSEGLSWKLSSLWFIPHKLYYVGGSGLYFQRTLGSSWKKDISYPPYYKFSIRGIDLNDIVIVGSYGSISHFNGYTWKYFVENESPEYNGEFSAVDIKNNIIVTVGIEFGSNRDILVLGNRN